VSGSRNGRSSRISVTDSSGGIPLADLIASTPGPHSSSACAGGNAALGENTPLARRRPRSTGAAGSPKPGITNDDVLIDGSKVAIRFHGEGDNTGTPATGRHARVTGIRRRFAEGVVQRPWRMILCSAPAPPRRRGKPERSEWGRLVSSMQQGGHVKTMRSQRSGFAGFRFPAEVITVAVPLVPAVQPLLPGTSRSCSPKRGVEIDHTSGYRWVRRFTPLFIAAARPCRHRPGDRWYRRDLREGRRPVALPPVCTGVSTKSGQVIDVYVSMRRNREAARRFFQRALAVAAQPVEVNHRPGPGLPLAEPLPAACHGTDHYPSNRGEADHGRLKARLRPMRGLKRERSLRTVAAGHAFIEPRPL